jgi:hypothetical protein
MSTINLFKGLNSERKIIEHSGSLRTLDLDWEHVKILKGDKEVTPDYEVQENDVLIIQEYPGGITALSIIAIGVSLVAGIGSGIYAHYQTQKAKKEMDEALSRIGKDNKKNEVSAIPQLADARNEKADGKNAPIILGRHLFTPYFLSEPYMRPAGTDGEDLYWYGTFLCGQDGLCFEKIRNGEIDLVTFTGDTAQYGLKYFDKPIGDDPPFYTKENCVVIAQKGHGFDASELTQGEPASIFEEKWVDSLDSTVEIGRKKKDGAKAVDEDGKPDENGLWVDDEGAEPIERATARFPMKAEIELFVDGLYGWDSKSGKATEAVIDLKLEWSIDGKSNRHDIPLTFTNSTNTETVESKPSNTSIANWVNTYIKTNPSQSKPASLSYTRNLADEGLTGTFGVLRFTSIKFEKHLKYAAGVYNIIYKITFIRAAGDVFVETPNKTTIGGDVEITKTTAATGGYITKASTKQMRFLAEVDFSKDADYVRNVDLKKGSPVYIKATRNNRMYISSYKDKVYLSAIRTQQYNPKESNNTKLVPAKNINDKIKAKFCRVGIKLKVNKNTQDNLDKFNIIASMTGRTWNPASGWSTTKTKTSNPAAVLLELLTGLIHNPSKYSDDEDDEIDLDSFGRLYRYCKDREVKIEDETAPHKFDLECNGVLTRGTKKQDVIKSILATCDGGLYINEFGILEVYYDDVQTTPIALLNPQRIVKMVEQRSLERKTDGYVVEFVDQDAGWQTDTHRILRPKEDLNSGLTTWGQLKLDYTTSYYQAMWHTRRIMAKEIHRPGEVKISVGKEGRYYKPGSLIKVQHERFKIGLGSGEIVSLIKDKGQIVGLQLMESFDIASDRDYWVEFYVVDGEKNRVVTRRIKSVGEYTNQLLFTVAEGFENQYPATVSEENAPIYGNILSVMYGEKTSTLKLWEASRYLVSDLSENDLGYDLTLVPYNEIVYETTSIHDIPDYKSSILSPAPVVYEEQQRKELANQIDEVRERTRPENMNRIAKSVTAESTPRFRGVYYEIGYIDEEGRGVIGGDIMNLEDYVYYAGVTGEWETMHIFQWTSFGWEMKARPSDDTSAGWMYMDAAASIGEGQPVGLFSDVFCQALTAHTAFIKNLYMQQGVVRQGGSLQSEDFVDGVKGKGWQINNNKITIENGVFRGIMFASGGEFENVKTDSITITGGTISIGPLHVSSVKTDPSKNQVYPGTTRIVAFVNEYLPATPSSGSITTTRTIYYGGSYGSGASILDLYSIDFTKEWVSVSQGPTGANNLVYRAVFNTSAGKKTVEVQVQNNTNPQLNIATIGQQVTIKGGGEGYTFQLTDLPESDPKEKGKLYYNRNTGQVFISM